MNTVERHSYIIKKINEEGQVKVQNLYDKLKVSPVTVRKDLKLLEEKEILYRMHGGATLNNPYTTYRHVNEKEKILLNEKMQIGAIAADMVTANDSILIASGTTVLSLAKNIQPQENLSNAKTPMRKTFNGKLLVMVQSTGKAGEIRVRAKSKEIDGAEIVLQAKKML